MEPYQVSFVAAILLAMAEMLTLTLIFAGFAVGMLAVSLAQLLSGSYSLNRDILLFSVVSLMFVIGLRRIFRSQKDQSRLTEEDINRY